MTKDNIMMFTFRLFLLIIGIEIGLPLPNDTSNLKKGIAKINGSFFRR